MRITVEFHGVLRQLAGNEHIVLELAGTTVAEALDELCRQRPALGPQLPRTACAVGTDLLRRGDCLNDGSVLSLIPPVSGGSR